eukprot:Lankesteria_metandrocarpae@DN8394_c0_g1_i1.p1
MDSRAKEIFVLFDADGDGLLQARDLGIAVRALGMNPTEGELNAMTATKVEFSFEEFLKFVEGKIVPKDQMIENLTKSFKQFDRNHTGTVSTSELTQVLLNLGDQIQEHEVSKLALLADPNSTGSVDYAALAKVLVG